MPDQDRLLTTLGLLIVAAPFALLAVFFAAFLGQRRMEEQTIGRLIQGAIYVSLVAALGAAAIMLAHHLPHFTI